MSRAIRRRDHPDSLGKMLARQAKRARQVGVRAATSAQRQVEAGLDLSGASNPPDPALTAGSRPDFSPAFTVRGFEGGLQILTDPVPPNTMLDVYVDGVLVAAGQRTTYIAVTVNAAGMPMTVDPIATAYAVTVVARNNAGSAAASGPVAGVRDLHYPTTEWFYTVLADTIRTRVLEALQVSSGEGNFVSLTVARLLITGALNYIQGALLLAAGVANPTDKPSVTPAGWDTRTVSVDVDPSYCRGLVVDGSNWVTAISAPFAYSVRGYSTSTGAQTFGVFMPGGFRPVGGVTKIGSSWYVLGQDDNRGGDWYVFVFDATWTKTGEWQPVNGSSVPLAFPSGGAIGVSGSAVAIGRVTNGGALVASLHNASTGAQNSTTTYGSGYSGEVTAILFTSAGFAANRVVFAQRTRTRVFDNSAVRVASDEWTPASDLYGLTHNGTIWQSLDGAKVSDYTNLTGSWDFRYSYATPAGPYETGPSQIRNIISLDRQKWTIAGTAPSDAAITAVRLHASTIGNSAVRQATVTASPWSQTFSTLLTSGTGTTTNNYPTGNAGALKSVATDGTNPLTNIPGDTSTPRLAKLIQSNQVVVNVSTGGTTATTTVTFAVPFATVPRVVVTVDSTNLAFDAGKSSVTTTGFTLSAVRPSAGVVTVDWIATTGA